MEHLGVKGIFNASYSPDYNPIELVFSKLKQLVRTLKPRESHELIEAAAHAIRQISPSDIDACFNHCGYVTT